MLHWVHCMLTGSTLPTPQEKKNTIRTKYDVTTWNFTQEMVGRFHTPFLLPRQELEIKIRPIELV